MPTFFQKGGPADSGYLDGKFHNKYSPHYWDLSKHPVTFVEGLVAVEGDDLTPAEVSQYARAYYSILNK